MAVLKLEDMQKLFLTGTLAKHAIIGVILSLMLAPWSVANSNGPTYDQVMRVSDKTFLQQFKETFVKDFCIDGSPFRDCYDVSQKKCESSLAASIPACAKEVRLPKSIRLDLHSSKAGELMGRCLGAQYMRQLKNSRIKNDYCQRRDRWPTKIQ